MGAKINYEDFLKKLDAKLQKYALAHRENICCTKGCSDCCEQGDYPLSEIELKYLIKGFLLLTNNTVKVIQSNIKKMKKGGACPFLINKECSIYDYRPIICRAHGLAYKAENVIVPYCANNKKNYSKIYNNGVLLTEPIQENLSTLNLIKEYTNGEIPVIRSMYDWLKQY